jgi:hypothetical protein
LSSLASEDMRKDSFLLKPFLYSFAKGSISSHFLQEIVNYLLRKLSACQGIHQKKELQVSGNGDHTTEDLWNRAVSPVAFDHAVKPRQVGLMVTEIGSENPLEKDDEGAAVARPILSTLPQK